ncbi:class II aldolase/adducin family protein [Conexibacter sp. CPCC 206217]|uniref:class II aldolase/adducin family protein n=1 Tax=Conexibacter sp. CPCC 206217 TaxID=3064574 RepID=UPI0027178815|nr:class II aldolase/adducin family protein [Conexibacter sp. CPCC 206217]MDO8213174.1 class II aldolase/adducin family protein [Conexibacter sp. CPCC 206217]
MSVRVDPSAVPSALVDLSRRLGARSRDLVVLAEGNTSTVLADGTIAVKRSGARMDGARPEDFALVEPAPLVALLDDPASTQEALDEALTSVAGPAGARASLETLVHVAAVVHGGARWVAHTHPSPVVGLLCTPGAASLWAAPLFPDEMVVLGTPAWVAYHEPGLALGRAVADVLRAPRGGAPAPRLLLLANHGIVALGESAAAVEAVTDMCVKAARVRAVALAAGGIEPLDVAHAATLADRPDEAHRRRDLFGASPGTAAGA